MFVARPRSEAVQLFSSYSVLFVLIKSGNGFRVCTVGNEIGFLFDSSHMSRIWSM